MLFWLIKLFSTFVNNFCLQVGSLCFSACCCCSVYVHGACFLLCRLDDLLAPTYVKLSEPNQRAWDLYIEHGKWHGGVLTTATITVETIAQSHSTPTPSPMLSLFFLFCIWISAYVFCPSDSLAMRVYAKHHAPQSKVVNLCARNTSNNKLSNITARARACLIRDRKLIFHYMYAHLCLHERINYAEKIIKLDWTLCSCKSWVAVLLFRPSFFCANISSF